MKYCEVCGEELRVDAAFCPKCGSRTGIELKSNSLTAKTDGAEVAQDYLNKLKDGAGVLGQKAAEIGGKISEKASEASESISTSIKNAEDKRLAAKSEAVKMTSKSETAHTPSTNNITSFSEGNNTSKKATASQSLKVSAPRERKKVKVGNIVGALLTVSVIGIAAFIFYLSRFTVVGVWGVSALQNVNESDFNMDDATEKGIYTFIKTLGNGTKLAFTKDGAVVVSESAGIVSLGSDALSYSLSGNNSMSLNVKVLMVSASIPVSYEWDGPNRLTLELYGKKIELTRQKGEDPEELKNKSSGTGLNINLGGDGSDDSGIGLSINLGGEDSDGSNIGISTGNEDLDNAIDGIKDKLFGN
ncbi:zinc ribbon domain-containing protein [Butyrivibrio sp. JL13D10]|uniref:zinc ribbon domain-containing protein n=1 Tax=Butyrivibrio sp. JL13D10 TaxID=3236815 RepID=UPI0038B4B2DF